MNKIYLLIVLFLLPLFCFSQNSTDTIRQEAILRSVDSLAFILCINDIAELSVIRDGVKRNNLNIAEKQVYLEHFNNKFGKLFGSSKNFIDLKNRLKKKGDGYEDYIKITAKVNAIKILYEQSLKKIKLNKN